MKFKLLLLVGDDVLLCNQGTLQCYLSHMVGYSNQQCTEESQNLIFLVCRRILESQNLRILVYRRIWQQSFSFIIRGWCGDMAVQLTVLCAPFDCTVSTVQCVLCTVNCSLCSVQCALFTVECAMYTVHCRVCTVHYVL